MNIAYLESEMPVSKQVSSPYRNWKVKQYTVSLETRLVQERARQHQPPLISLHAKADAETEAISTAK
ncbi:MAG: hypothetical protein WBF88_09685 [Pusillimonas sp.]